MRTARHIAVSAWLALSPPLLSYAETRVLPKGTTVSIQDDPKTEKNEAILIDLDTTHFLIERAYANQANTTAKLARRLESELKKCSSSAERLPVRENRVIASLRWIGIGALVSGAFFLGMAVGE